MQTNTKKMIISYIYKILALLFVPFIMQAQVINAGDVIFISAGEDFKINNDVIINQSSGQIVNNGNLYIGGTSYTQNTGATYTGGAASWLWFDGGINQIITGDVPLTISRLRVDNGNQLQLNQQVNVSNQVDLNNNGNILLGTNDLILASGAGISAYNASNYIITNATGILQQEVTNTSVTFPIGNSSYNPATLINSGTIDNFQVRVFDQVFDQGTTGIIQTDNAVNRTWMISESIVGGSNVTTTLQWITAEEMGVFDRANSGVARHLTGINWDLPPAYTTATNIGLNTWTQSRSNITSFSPFVVHDVNSPLPIELLRFDAKRMNPHQVRLDWATVSEINNKGFHIERMLEHETGFTTVGWQHGQGTTINTHNYQFIDENSYTSTSYYRLRQEDYDGTISYSDIKAVGGIKKGLFSDINVFPNPVDDNLNIAFKNLPVGTEQVQVEILSVTGQLLHQHIYPIAANSRVKIDYVQELIPAMYLISVKLDSGDKYIQKFIKRESN